MPPTNPKRGRGRQASPDSRIPLYFRVSVELAEFIHAEAQAKGQPYAEWLRRLIQTHRHSVTAGRKASAKGERA